MYRGAAPISPLKGQLPLQNPIFKVFAQGAFDRRLWRKKGES
jgi:hypothetical protein